MTGEPIMDHKSIYSALAAAQSEMEAVTKDAKNAAFKKPDGTVSRYADLAAVVDAVRPALTRHGIAYFHQMVRYEGGLSMKTILAHGASDTTIDCEVPLIVATNNMQGMKSATTYAKRIGLESVTGIAPEDDDGNAAAKAPPPKAEAIAPINDALRQAREDAVTDSLPDNATPAQKAKAFADAMIEAFKACTGEKALDNRWMRDVEALNRLEERYPELHGKVCEAYDLRRNEIKEGQPV